MNRGAWQATVHGVTKSQTELSDIQFRFKKTNMYTCTYYQTEFNGAKDNVCVIQ